MQKLKQKWFLAGLLIQQVATEAKIQNNKSKKTEIQETTGKNKHEGQRNN